MSVEAVATEFELTPEEMLLAEAPYGGGPVPEATSDDTDDSDVEDQEQETTEGADDDGSVEGEAAGGKESASEKNTEAEARAFDEADIERAKAIGLEDDDLKDFGSPKALRRYLDLEEKVAFLTAGKPDGDSTDEGKQSLDELLKLELYDGTDEAYSDEPFDDRSLGIARAVRREQELRIAAQKKLEGLEQFVSQLQHERIITQFSDAVDALSNPSLGEARDSRGRMVALSNAQIEARTQLFAEVEKIAADQQKKGKTSLTWEETVAEASNRLGVVKSKPAAAKSDALRKQSAARRPISSGSASARASSRDRDDERTADEIADDPALVAWWDKNVQR